MDLLVILIAALVFGLMAAAIRYCAKSTGG